MIRIREKDILFIAINLITFISYCSYWFMREAAFIGLSAIAKPYPTIEEGMMYLMYSFSVIALTIVGIITFLIDCWWIYRFIRELQDGYWKENL